MSNKASGSGGSRANRRREMDFMKLMHSHHTVYPSESVGEFWVEFHGPEGTPYEGGVWLLHVQLPDEYPFKSPSVGFANRILHPNVDEASGSVCLDVINQTWTPMYELQNIFDVFMPQLLRYPNPADPLNPTAAALLNNDPIGYAAYVQEHVATHATRAVALARLPASAAPAATEHDDKTGIARPVEVQRTDTAGGQAPAVPTASPVAHTEAAPAAADTEDYEPEEIDI